MTSIVNSTSSDSSGEETTMGYDTPICGPKSWKENPVLVSAHLIPPPCPKKVEGVGVVKDIIPIDPGNGYEPPSDPDVESLPPEPILTCA